MISSLIDAELSQAEKKILEEHLDVCANCRTLEEWLRCVKQGISRAAESLAIPGSLRDKIFASLADAPPRPESGPWWKRLLKLP